MTMVSFYKTAAYVARFQGDTHAMEGTSENEPGCSGSFEVPVLFSGKHRTVSSGALTHRKEVLRSRPVKLSLIRKKYQL